MSERPANAGLSHLCVPTPQRGGNKRWIDVLFAPVEIPPPPDSTSSERLYDGMVQRREIGLRMFVGWVTFTLLVIRGAFDLHVRAADVGYSRVLLQVLVAGTYALLLGMLVQIELTNTRGRRKYAPAKGTTEPRHRPITRGWATTWTLAAGLLLAVVACLLFQRLPLTNDGAACVADARSCVGLTVVPTVNPRSSLSDAAVHG